MNLSLIDFTPAEFISIINPLGYLKDKQKELEIFYEDVLSNEINILDLYNIQYHALGDCPKEEAPPVIIKPYELNTNHCYQAFPIAFAKHIGLKSFISSNLVFDNKAYLYLSKAIEEKSKFKESLHQGIAVTFVFNRYFTLNKDIAFLINSLLEDSIPCVAVVTETSNGNIKDDDECMFLDMLKIKMQRSIVGLLEHIVNSKVVVSALNQYTLLSCNCFVPTVVCDVSKRLYKYINPYQPHIFCTEDANSRYQDINNFKQTIIKAYEFYDSA